MPEKEDSISIVIPCFEQGTLLGAAITSALDQTLPPCEVIVVDDGSTDDTRVVAAQYGKQVKYVYQSNSGLSAARNTGLARVHGRFTLFLDSDDLLAPTSLESLVAMTNDNTIGVMHFQKFYHSPGDGGLSHPPATSDTFSTLVHRNIAPVHCFLTPTAALREVGGFAVELDSCEDWDIWIRLALLGLSYTPVADCGAMYRQTVNSMSTNHRRMLRARALVAARYYRAAAERRDIYDQLMPEFEACFVRIVHRHYAQKQCSATLESIEHWLEELSVPLTHQRIVNDLLRLVGLNRHWLSARISKYLTPKYFKFLTSGYN